ncbi:hypothetical protein PIB30_065463 [Stylosanthes scabra]|uniref:Uncharacterized protein n=1 Tax=Stylosanthes scabra TaxID=79078 RepID=A0ABU6XLS0_9FABA|nr:hypothetical protein [Stylosanthes scabra]
MRLIIFGSKKRGKIKLGANGNKQNPSPSPLLPAHPKPAARRRSPTSPFLRKPPYLPSPSHNSPCSLPLLHAFITAHCLCSPFPSLYLSHHHLTTHHRASNSAPLLYSSTLRTDFRHGVSLSTAAGTCCHREFRDILASLPVSKPRLCLLCPALTATAPTAAPSSALLLSSSLSSAVPPVKPSFAAVFSYVAPSFPTLFSGGDFVYKVSSLSPAKHFIIHSRKALLNGITPAENRSIPPLKYEYFYGLLRDFPDLTFTINGGIASIDEVNFGPHSV